MRRCMILQNTFGVGLSLLVSISTLAQNKQDKLAAKQRIQQAEAACGDPMAKFKVQQPGTLIQPTVSIGEDAARVYILQDVVIPYKPGQNMAWEPTIKVGLNGKWIGATRGRSYIVLPVKAGENHFCGQVQLSRLMWPSRCFLTGNTALLRLHVAAGQTYYVRAKTYRIDLGDYGFVCSINLDTVNSDEGRLLLAESRPAAWKEIPHKPRQHKKNPPP